MIYAFGSCVLDTDRFELTINGEPVTVEPQAFEVLCYLIEHRDRLVSRSELFDEVWKTRFVTDSALATRIKQLRRCLGDDGQRQEVIRTVHGRGIRFVADVSVHESWMSSSTRTAETPAVGRTTEQAQLEHAMGSRGVVLVSGEPGAGKTTLVDRVAAVWQANGHLVARGQCIEHLGAGEPYRPLLDAFDQLARSDNGVEVAALMERLAPMWLVQLPWLVSADAHEQLRAQVLGSTRDRMLREAVGLLDAIADRAPLVLVLDDVQWSDPSTLDVLALLSRRRSAAQLLTVMTCRRDALADPTSRIGEVVHELRSQDTVLEIELTPLDDVATSAVIESQCGARPDSDLTQLVCARATGNPLHIKSLVDDWLERGVIERSDDACRLAVPAAMLSHEVPDSLRRLIERRLERVDADDRELLEAASVAGQEYSAASVAEAVLIDVESCETRLARLARHRLLIAPAGHATWPDGTIAGVFRFGHAVYQELLYDEVPPHKRARLHQRIGLCHEAAFGLEDSSHASDLMRHFVNSGDSERAIAHIRIAVEHALDKDATVEALELAQIGLDIAGSLPDGEVRRRHELAMAMTLGPLMSATHGWAAPEVEAAYQRAHDLAREVPEPDGALPSILFGLATHREYRAQFRDAETLVRDVLELEEDDDDAVHRMGVRELLACSLYHQGQFAPAVTAAEQGIDLYKPSRHREIHARYGMNPGVGCHGFGALASWYLGEDSQAVAFMDGGIDLARRADHAFSLASAHEFAAELHQLREDVDAVVDHAERASVLAAAQGFELRVATAGLFRAWASVVAGEPVDLLEVQRHLERYRATGTRMDLPHYVGLVARITLESGFPEDASSMVDEAVAMITDRPSCHAPELHRLRAVILDANGRAANEVAAALRDAYDLAVELGAQSVQQRVTSTGRRLGVDL